MRTGRPFAAVSVCVFSIFPEILKPIRRERCVARPGTPASKAISALEGLTAFVKAFRGNPLWSNVLVFHEDHYRISSSFEVTDASWERSSPCPLVKEQVAA
jgi:hypothetical protein